MGEKVDVFSRTVSGHSYWGFAQDLTFTGRLL